jgi:hypothetical protein
MDVLPNPVEGSGMVFTRQKRLIMRQASVLAITTGLLLTGAVSVTSATPPASQTPATVSVARTVTGYLKNSTGLTWKLTKAETPKGGWVAGGRPPETLAPGAEATWKVWNDSYAGSTAEVHYENAGVGYWVRTWATCPGGLPNSHSQKAGPGYTYDIKRTYDNGPQTNAYVVKWELYKARG